MLKSFVLAALEWVRWLDVPLLCLLVLLALPLRYLAQSSSLSDPGVPAIRWRVRPSPLF